MSKIVICTSRRPSPRTRSFVKDLANAFSGDRITRGKSSLEELLTLSVESGYDKIIIVDTRYGNPGRLRIYDVRSKELAAIIVLKGVTLTRENPRSIRFNPKGVVVLRTGYKLEDIMIGSLNLKAIENINYVPPRYGVLVVEESKNIGIIRFLEVNSLRDYGPILRIRRVYY